MQIAELQPEKFEIRVEKLPPEPGKPRDIPAPRGWFAWCKRHKKLSGLGLFLIGVVLNGIAIYGFESEAGLVRFMSRIVPYPAAKVNGNSISYYRFLKEVALARKISESGSALLPAAGNFRKQAFERLIRYELLEGLADDNDIKVSERDVEEIYGEVLKSENYTDDEMVLLVATLKSFILVSQLQEKLGAGTLEQELNRLVAERVKKYIRP